MKHVYTRQARQVIRTCDSPCPSPKYLETLNLCRADSGTMKISPVIAAVALAVAFVPAHADAAAYVATSPGLDGINHRILTAHNEARAEVGAPPLQWDAGLAVAAASYGPALSRMGRLVHSPRAGRENQRENLWMGQQGRFHPEEMVGTWADEKRLFFPGAFPTSAAPAIGWTSPTIRR
jgi:hypothetical protein